ncbi:MAG: hypothetical protein HYW90_01850 [Candidatus Sungbacteria bacterium]|nr:hypothetical protein [Candidatus Sungbacteria bacterium]
MNDANKVIRKDFWADGVWQVVFLLLPLAVGSVISVAILLYGAYATFQYEPEHGRAIFLFSLFFLIGTAAAALFIRTLWKSLNEKMTFTNEQISYGGFGSFSLPYSSIKRVALSEHEGLLGKERMLFFLAGDGVSKDKMYAIPRWNSLAGGVLARELSSRMTLSILDHNILSFYAARRGVERFLPLLFAGAGILFVISFFIARSSGGVLAGLIMLFWITLAAAIIFILWRHMSIRKKLATI